MAVDDPPKLSRFEIVGAWLGIWEPPRDAHVPPVPWRTLGLATLAILVVGGAAAAIIAPRVDDAKDTSAAREQRGLDARAAARRAKLIREQQPRTGRADEGSRTATLAVIEARIGADARERFHPRARPALCEPTPGGDVAADRVAYDCTSAIRDIVGAGDQEGALGAIAIPFRAVVDFEAGTYVFCKVSPPPGEQVIPDPRTIVRLPKACARPDAP